jgi:uncharacterized paraquat-inducible protein A
VHDGKHRVTTRLTLTFGPHRVQRNKMPYTHCPSCRLATFTASAHSSLDECPRCGTQLELRPRPLFVVPDARLAEPSADSPPEAA